MKRLRSVILIDGSNFYFKLKDLKLHNLLKFNFSGFCTFLSKDTQLISSCYYVGAVKIDGTKKSRKMQANQQKLIASLRKHHVGYSLGYLLKSDGVYREKGVDVQIAVDLLVATYENTCDRIVLVSSDTDLLPAVKRARDKGKLVEYIGFSHQPSLAMVANCTTSRLLTKDDLKPYTMLSKSRDS
jgi:uncharacterized LabA/DUF88 family protein